MIISERRALFIIISNAEASCSVLQKILFGIVASVQMACVCVCVWGGGGGGECSLCTKIVKCKEQPIFMAHFTACTQSPELKMFVGFLVFMITFIFLLQSL